MEPSNMHTASAEAHPFTLAGLGQAPFHVVGSGERVYQACPGAPVQAGGCCRYCGTSIRYAVIIRSADGQVFDVGSECVRKVDVEAWREYKAMRREELRAARAAYFAEARSAERAAQIAEQERRARENEASFRAREPELACAIDTLLPLPEYPGHLAARALRSVQVCGEVAERDEQHETAWKLRELVAEHTASGYVGTEGKRATFRARYVGRHSFDTAFGPKRVYKFEVARDDGSHALATWITASYLTSEGSTPLPIGSVLDVTATIKAHAAFRGVSQTEILRPKFKVIETA